MKEAAIIALIAAAAAALLSLVILRLMNGRFVRLPLPEAFYSVSAPITVGLDGAGNPTWSGRQSLEFPAKEYRPVRSDSPGRTLDASPVSIRRKMPPWWRPFKSPTAAVQGKGTTVARPDGQTSFAQMVVLSTDVPTRPTLGQQLPAVVTLLIPRKGQFTVDQRLVSDVQQMAGELVNRLPDGPPVSGGENGQRPTPPSGSGPAAGGGEGRPPVGPPPRVSTAGGQTPAPGGPPPRPTGGSTPPPRPTPPPGARPGPPPPPRPGPPPRLP